MSVDNLSEQHALIQSLATNLKHNDDAQIGRRIMHRIEETHAKRQQALDTTQETLQQLSRRLQTARSRVDSSKAQREAKSHADTMRDMREEKEATESAIDAQEKQGGVLEREIDALEDRIALLDDSVEALAPASDEAVLKLQILRSLGVEPLVDADGGSVAVARVWSQASASSVPIDDDSVPAHQLASRLWDACSL
ncbi:hypothetical protein H4217_004499 [Coemansia sp. RSA 1939]|nr:hypothetical protein H4217_004499 [Coemansia sp. RSA 1939]KAJ2589008.1 hypothetical protein EV177_009313 [Coemansia sp. RSA 1804]KAJ2681293.1 hypothetical protein GGH99_005283 [Coemansia sp. RSA 1285]